MEAHYHLISALLIFAVGLAGGGWALRAGAATNDRSQYLVRLGASMAGGVFLGAGLIHMLGDSGATFARLWPDLNFPLAYLIAAFGVK